jgi:hypothetical protein
MKESIVNAAIKLNVSAERIHELESIICKEEASEESFLDDMKGWVKKFM